jgi:hypothetical protein
MAAGAMFVAAEFSLVTVNKNNVKAAAEQGDKKADGVLKALSTLSTQLSGAQLGITITNLGMGFVAEPAIAVLITPVLEDFGMSATQARGVSVTLAPPTAFSDCSASNHKRNSHPHVLPKNLGSWYATRRSRECSHRKPHNLWNDPLHSVNAVRTTR